MTGLERVATGPSWCDGVSSRPIDHICYDGSSLRVDSVKEWFDGVSAIPNASMPSDHAPIAVTVTVTAAAPGGPPVARIVGDSLSAAQRSDIRVRYAAIVARLQPPHVKGKPNEQQLATLRSFSEAKDAFVASLDGDAQAYAKAVCANKKGLLE